MEQLCLYLSEEDLWNSSGQDHHLLNQLMVTVNMSLVICFS